MPSADLPTCTFCLGPITEGGVKDGDSHLCLRCAGEIEPSQVKRRWIDLTVDEQAALPDGTVARRDASGVNWTKHGSTWVRFSPASPNLSDCGSPPSDAFVEVPRRVETAASVDLDALLRLPVPPGDLVLLWGMRWALEQGRAGVVLPSLDRITLALRVSKLEAGHTPEQRRVLVDACKELLPDRKGDRS